MKIERVWILLCSYIPILTSIEEKLKLQKKLLQIIGIAFSVFSVSFHSCCNFVIEPGTKIQININITIDFQEIQESWISPFQCSIVGSLSIPYQLTKSPLFPCPITFLFITQIHNCHTHITISVLIKTVYNLPPN